MHQLCNGCFIIYATPNLQYIHSYLYTYANLWDQICIRFAMVVLLCLLYQICTTYTHTFTHTQIYGIKFASYLQWSFYYVNYTKFALHTLIPLHIRKFIGSNLHEICNGSFIIFTIPNLHYIHSYFCRYANLYNQICIKFARVVYS